MHRSRWYVNLADFANIVKAFIGSNYLTVAYAFSQSGIALGAGGMILIAGLTDHCCQLIVKTKHYIIKKTKHIKHDNIDTNKTFERSYKYTKSGEHISDSGVSVEEDSGKITSTQSGDVNNTQPREITAAKYDEKKSSVEIVMEGDSAEEYMLKYMSYGDVGKQCFGEAGLGLVNFFIALTQFGFCTNYFIFIGNTIHSLFPIKYCYPYPFTEQKYCDEIMTNNSGKGYTAIVPDYLGDNISTIGPNASLLTTTAPTNNATIPWSTELVSSAPDLMLLVAAPMPIFVVFALVRNVRYLGMVSVIANVAILGGCAAVFGFLLDGFEVHETIRIANWDDFFVFFGMVTAAFEGIGLVIPIESSMEGNRHLFPWFLHGAMLTLTAVLGTFGCLGYLKFGSGVDQMLNKNIPSGDPLSAVVNVGICFGILLTFPLQIFPVIEIIEKYLFTKGKICGPSHDDDEDDSLLKVPTGSHTGVTHISKAVSTWKRNVVRILIVIFACGLAVLLRNYFAYVSALIGALGSSILVFVLPCLFHLKLCWKDINIFIKAKDTIVVVFGIVASIFCVYGVAKQIASGSVAH